MHTKTLRSRSIHRYTCKYQNTKCYILCVNIWIDTNICDKGPSKHHSSSMHMATKILRAGLGSTDVSVKNCCAVTKYYNFISAWKLALYVVSIPAFSQSTNALKLIWKEIMGTLHNAHTEKHTWRAKGPNNILCWAAGCAASTLKCNKKGKPSHRMECLTASFTSKHPNSCHCCTPSASFHRDKHTLYTIY